MKVDVLDRSGRVRSMDQRYARILDRLGRVTYMTRDMQAAPVRPQSLVPESSEQTQKKRKRKARAEE